MELENLILVFIIFSAGTYLFLQVNLTDFILGFTLLSNGINLMILFTSGNPMGKSVPIIGDSSSFNYVDPLPQALILTAIVIGLGLTAFMIVLMFRLFGYYGTTNTHQFTKLEQDE